MPNERSITEKIPKVLNGKAAFKFINGARKNEVVQIDKDIFFIGRSENNNLVASDRTVSRKHAVVNFIDDQYVISDLNSFKGMYINDKKTHEAILNTGDRLKLGNSVFEFSLNGEFLGVSYKGGSKINFKPMLYSILAAVLAFVIINFLFFGSDKPLKHEPADDIETYYSMGIKAYNVQKDYDLAASYWNKVLDLDPERKTIQARNALILLENIGANGSEPQNPTGETFEDIPPGGEEPVE